MVRRLQVVLGILVRAVMVRWVAVVLRDFPRRQRVLLRVVVASPTPVLLRVAVYHRRAGPFPLLRDWHLRSPVCVVVRQ